MKRLVVAIVGLVVGVGLLWGCASMQAWPESERSAENKMALIQEEIGDGLKTGALTPDQSQSFLTKLKVIRTDYTALRDKPVYREEWNSLQARLDALGEDVNSARARTTRRDDPRNGDRIVALQRRLDEGRSDGRLPQPEGRDLQARLDTIRGDYSRMTDGGRTISYEERDRVQGRLDALDADVTRALAPTARRDDPRNGDRIVALQRRIDDGRNSGRVPQTEGRELQGRLDGIRSDSSRMTDGGRAATYAERTDISRRLDSVERDLDR